MRIIKASAIREYAAKHPSARTSLAAWLVAASRSRWKSILDVRRTYPHADAVLTDNGNTVTIFNIAGNHFRLVVAIHYNTQRIYIREFMTHAQYDSQAWKGRH